jgi:hypothetical protein
MLAPVRHSMTVYELSPPASVRSSQTLPSVVIFTDEVTEGLAPREESAGYDDEPG